MSSARVCSPPMDHIGSLGTGPRTLVSAHRNTVSRNLFGAPDRSSSFARDKITEIRAKSIKKWNFDFEKEKPLEGRFIWTPVESSQSSILPGKRTAGVPQAYDLKRMNIGSGAQLSSASSSSTTSPSSSSISNKSTDGFASKYFVPAVLPDEPLLIVRGSQYSLPPAPTTTTSSNSTSHSQSLIEQENETTNPRTTSHQMIPSDYKKQSNTKNNPDTCLLPSSSSSSSPKSSIIPVPQSSESSPPTTPTESSSSNTSVKINKAKTRHQKQAQMTDFFKVQKAVKRNAESPSLVGGEKKAAL